METVLSYPGFGDRSLPILGEEKGVVDYSAGRFLYEVGTARPVAGEGVVVVRHCISADGLGHLVERLRHNGTGTVLFVHLVGKAPRLEGFDNE